MHATTLITGGCRSGKSNHALKLATDMRRQPQTFVATCTPQDEEMRQRVQRHQQERGAEWNTLEVPVKLAEALTRHGKKAGVMLVDCLTLWISNMMMEDADDQTVQQMCKEVCNVLIAPPCPIILVSNEVGTGIVPENPLARRYRDLAGWTNQQIAAACQSVIWMVAGIPVTIKS